jgi:diguanylate cyclase (GGDEF)-like protein/PAS domain S-box-containing protein
MKTRERILHFWPLLMAAAFLLLVLILSWSLYSTQSQLRATTDARLIADSIRRAAVVEDFLSEQERLAVQLAGSREIEDYLTNRALGMSPRYGLNANLGYIEQLFARTIEETSLRGERVLKRIMFLDAGAVELARAGQGARWRVSVDPGRASKVEVVPETWTIETVANVRFKNDAVGVLATSADLRALSRLLIEQNGRSGGYHELLLVGRDDYALSPDGASVQLGPAFASLPDNRIVPATQVPGGEPFAGMLALRTPINGAPLSLLTLTSESAAYGQLVSPVYALYVGAFTLVLFIMAIGFERLRRRATRLQSDFAESDRLREQLARHNASLSEEIALRKALEEDLQRKTKALDETNADLRIAATAFDSQEGMIVTDADRRILRINRTFSELSGYEPGELLGKPTTVLRPDRNDPAVLQNMQEMLETNGRWQGEMWLRTKNGSPVERWLTISAVKDRDGRTTHFVGAYYDMSERRKAEQKIRELAFYDQLTGLPNRTLLLDRARQTVSVSFDSRTYAALLFIDLDHFKTLNDTLGHAKGDKLLRQAAKRIESCVRATDTVSRFGGDEFVVLLTDLGTSDAMSAALHVESIGEQVLAALCEPHDLDGIVYRCTGSIGAALFCDDDVDMEELLKRADMAMYAAKSSGRNAMRFFDPEMQEVVESRAALEADLRADIARKNFVLHYQPQISSSGELIGAEALLRWPRPGPNPPSPAEFIPLAESTGLILPLGDWVMEAACRQLAEWAHHPTLSDMSIAVNVSAVQLHHPGFVDRVGEIVVRTGANARRLTLEVTEGFEIARIEEVIAKMTVLRKMGVSFSLDDFGTGYSSLSYLKRLPIDQLKIDKSFVRDVLVDPNDAAIAEMIIALGETLGLGIIAEGVETEEQRTFLESRGCCGFQGYLFARPMPQQQFEQYAALFHRPYLKMSRRSSR